MVHRRKKYPTTKEYRELAPIPRVPLSSPLSEGERWFLLDCCIGIQHPERKDDDGKPKQVRTGANRKHFASKRRCKTCRAMIVSSVCRTCHPWVGPAPLFPKDRMALDKTAVDLDGNPTDITLSPEAIEGARIVRDVGFTDEEGRYHAPWTEADYARANVYRQEPFSLDEQMFKEV